MEEGAPFADTQTQHFQKVDFTFLPGEAKPRFKVFDQNREVHSVLKAR
jgi:hypothetical protein